ncbi:MAG: EsaB/YukD family protein [Nitrospira sp.]|nr:EsaB/YukD family protein [Nitrospira sp.]
MTVAIEDWSGSRGAAEFTELDGSTTVSELLAEAREALRLPRDGVYSLIRGNDKLARTATLDEAGIRDQETLQISPEVSAG